jgi:hypothetical protein
MKTNKQIQTKEPNQKVYKLFNTINNMEKQISPLLNGGLNGGLKKRSF